MVVDPITLAEVFVGVTIIAGAWIAILSWFFESRRMIRWRELSIYISISFFLSMIFNCFAIIFSVYNLTLLTDVTFTLTMVFIIVAFIFISIISRQIASWEKFAVVPTKTKIASKIRPEEKEIEKYGMPCLDQLTLGKQERTPLIIYGHEGTHPWRLAHHFICNGLIEKEACIYLTATKPPELILEELKRLFKNAYGKDLERFRQNFAIIDCFTPFAGFKEKDVFPTKDDYKKEGWTYFDADPRDLNSINVAYAIIRDMFEGKKIRIVYDGFSTVIDLTDHESLYQYMLHNVALEDKFGYTSLYLIREEGEAQWMNPLVGGILRLDIMEGERTIEIIKMKGKFRDGIFKIDDNEKVVRRMSKPKLIKEY